jgi:putative protease
MGKPEILSPAGYWPQLRAAIEAGADAVYFGLKHFTARAKVGFEPGELPEVMRTLHLRGVKGYVTFNSLVFDSELEEAGRAIEGIASAGADALIVQDLGIARLAREIAPDLDLHGSTQMSVTNADGVRLAERFGVRRVILARELSLDEIRTVRSATVCGLEIFVHGALCVSYSGQCFSSEAWGGRSANRGQCAQACRLPYEMVVDGKTAPLGDARYLLSPGDLCTLTEIPRILDLDIAALKIEGRYKDEEYVALTTRAYRDAVDRAWDGDHSPPSPATALQLEQVYSRGLGPFFLSGTNHQAVVRGRAPRHRGVLMGRVVRVGARAVWLEPEEANRTAPLKPGDGIVFDAADWRSPEEPEEGGRVYEVLAGNGVLELRFANTGLDTTRIRPGDLVWRTYDPDTAKDARRFTAASLPLRKQPVDVFVRAREGEPLRTVWSVGALRCEVSSPAPLPRAQNRAVTDELLKEQLGRLGNTAYQLRCLEADILGQPFAPASLLNQLRRNAIELLEASQASQKPVKTEDPKAALTKFLQSSGAVEEQAVELHLLVRTPEQLDAAVAARPASVTLDYLDLYGLRPSLERVRSAGLSVRVASPRIIKPGEERLAEFLLSCRCPILVRPAGLLDALSSKQHSQLIGDFSLNAANAVTASALLNLGLERITPTHDLNADQVGDLAAAVGPNRLEVFAFQHLPVFYTEHCVFCRFLSSGTSYRDCGRPCEKNVVALRDATGREHPVLADVGCRNTVFGAEAQEASAHLARWRAGGIRHFRLEFAHESGDQVYGIAQAFQKAMHQRAVPLSRELRALVPQGTTQGSLRVFAS